MIEPTDVRDLEKEGVMSMTWGIQANDALTHVKCDLRAQASGIKFKSIESQLNEMSGRLERLEGVLAVFVKEKLLPKK